MIYIAADHRGFRLKEEIKKFLDEGLYEYRDLGAVTYNKEDDYPDFAFKLGKTVTKDRGRGILICGSGAGASVAANKVKGIRAALCTLSRQVEAARNDDDINVLCLSADWVSLEDNEKIVTTFLNTFFSGEERHLRRLQKIHDYESQ